MAMAAGTDLNTQELTGTLAFASLPLANFNLHEETKRAGCERVGNCTYEVLDITYKWDSPVLQPCVLYTRGRLLHRNQVRTRV